MSNLDNIISSFHIQGELNPKIWSLPTEKFMGDPEGQHYQMRPKVRERLLEIAYEFIEFIKVDFVVSDVVMTGSLANYNWSKYSDIDLHIIADFSQFSKIELDLYQELFTLKKTLFNDKHDIKIFGYDTELYVQDEKEEHTSTGVYSVLYDKWINEPEPLTVKIDRDLVKTKAEKWMKEIDTILDNIQDESVENAKKILKTIKDKIKKYRKSGLEEKGEFSIENLVFKVLRRNNYIQKIFDFENKFVDKKLSLKESTTTLGDFKVDLEMGPENHSTRALGDWQSDNAWDMFAKPGTEVKSYTNGVVSKKYDSNKKSGQIYGTQLTIKGSDGYPDIFYTHIKNVKVKEGDKVNVGDYIGEVSEWCTDESCTKLNDGSHVHVGLPFGHTLKDLQKGNLSLSNNPEIKKAEKSKFLESLKKIALQDLTFKNLKEKGKKIPYNKDVEYIQTALQFLGFSLPKWGVDGLFGPETENAVKNFQKTYYLDETGVMKQDDLQTLYAVLILKGFEESDLSSIQFKSDFSKINVQNDKSFYEEILKNLNAPITDENLKFLYAWRQAEGGKAKNNPFNTTYKLTKDSNMSNYNSIGVKNYSTPEYGLEATLKTLLNNRYNCIVDGLRNDIGSQEISRCQSLKTWGTGDLVAKVLNQSNINPPQIYTV